MANPSSKSEPIKNSPAKVWDPLNSLVLVVFGVLATAFALVMAPLQVRDEEGHFLRAYLLSRGEFHGFAHAKVPGSILGFLRALPEGFNNWQKVSWSDPMAGASTNTPAAADSGMQPVVDDPKHKYLTTTLFGASVYFPLVYLPATAGILTARILHLSPLGMLYAGRIFNVFTVLIGLAIAFRLAPAYRALFSVIVLMPMTLGQSGALTADAVTIAVSLVGFALILHTRSHGADPRLLGVVLVFFTVWALCKTSLWALPLVLLIPSAAFGTNQRRALYVAAVAFAMVAAVGLWQLLAHEALEALRESRLTTMNVDVSANMNTLTRHPLEFARWLLVCLRQNAGAYANQFIGVFGWARVSLPTWARDIYLALVLVVALAEYAPKPFPPLDRGILILIFVGATLAIHAILFVSDGPRWGEVSAIQGRYFIPFCFAALVAMRQRTFTIRSNVLMPIIICVAAAEDMLALQRIWTYYYL